MKIEGWIEELRDLNDMDIIIDIHKTFGNVMATMTMSVA